MKRMGVGLPLSGRGRRPGYFRGAFFFVAVTAAVFAAGSAFTQVTPPAPPPEVTVIPLDNAVRLSWPRQADSLLTAVGVPEGGLDRWGGASLPIAGGLYAGLCDQDYAVKVRAGELIQGRLVFDWFKSPPDTVPPRQLEMTAADQLYDLDGSGGIRTGLARSDSLATGPANLAFGLDSLTQTLAFTGSWTGTAAPRDWGLWLRQRENGVLVFTAADSGTVDAGSTTPPGLTLNWSYYLDTPDSAARTGSIVIPGADTPVDVMFDSLITFPTADTIQVKAFRVELGAGTVVKDESFAVAVRPSVTTAEGANTFLVTGRSIEGYAIWRSEVIDLDHPIYVGRIQRCAGPADSAAFWSREVLEYIDPEAHNGYPYYYAVTASDTTVDTIDPATWNSLRIKAYPRSVQYDSTYSTGQSRFTDASRARAVPNPYKLDEEWEEGDSKIQFINLPPEATVYIYTESGDFVTSIRQTDPRSDRVDWNLRNGSGRKVVSGIYMFKVESPHGEKAGHFIVIR